MAERQSNALVPFVGSRAAKRRNWLGTVIVRAALFLRARQHDARFAAVPVGTATRNRSDARRWFPDVVIGATQ